MWPEEPEVLWGLITGTSSSPKQGSSLHYCAVTTQPCSGAVKQWLRCLVLVKTHKSVQYWISFSEEIGLIISRECEWMRLCCSCLGKNNRWACDRALLISYSWSLVHSTVRHAVTLQRKNLFFFFTSTMVAVIYRSHWYIPDVIDSRFPAVHARPLLEAICIASHPTVRECAWSQSSSTCHWWPGPPAENI